MRTASAFATRRRGIHVMDPRMSLKGPHAVRGIELRDWATRRPAPRAQKIRVIAAMNSGSIVQQIESATQVPTIAATNQANAGRNRLGIGGAAPSAGTDQFDRGSETLIGSRRGTIRSDTFRGMFHRSQPGCSTRASLKTSLKYAPILSI